jgi:hypothetical protein
MMHRPVTFTYCGRVLIASSLKRRAAFHSDNVGASAPLRYVAVYLSGYIVNVTCAYSWGKWALVYEVVQGTVTATSHVLTFAPLGAWVFSTRLRRCAQA